MLSNFSGFNASNAFLVPNEFFDRWLCCLNCSEIKVLLFIIKRSQKDGYASFSMGFLDEFEIHACLSKDTISKTITNLVNRNFIKKIQKGYGKDQMFIFELILEKANEGFSGYQKSDKIINGHSIAYLPK